MALKIAAIFAAVFVAAFVLPQIARIYFEARRDWRHHDEGGL